jgi:hypothetical protein
VDRNDSGWKATYFGRSVEFCHCSARESGCAVKTMLSAPVITHFHNAIIIIMMKSFIAGDANQPFRLSFEPQIVPKGAIIEYHGVISRQ